MWRQKFVFSDNLIFCVSVTVVVIHICWCRSTTATTDADDLWLWNGLFHSTQSPPLTPRNVLFMKVSLLCDHSSFDGRHWIVHDCQVHFYFLPGIALLFAKLRILPGVWRIFESLKVQHWVFMNLRPGLSTRVSMLNICKVLRFEKAQVRSGKVTILKGLTMTFATLVTCHCLNNRAVTSMWGRHGGADYNNCCRFVTSLLCGQGIHRFWRNLNLCFCPAVNFTLLWVFSDYGKGIPWILMQTNLCLFLLSEFHPVGKGKKCVFNFGLALIMMIDDDYDESSTMIMLLITITIYLGGFAVQLALVNHFHSHSF